VPLGVRAEKFLGIKKESIWLRGNPAMSDRKASIERNTNETKISLSLNIDGTGTAEVHSGIGFLDHLISTLARHAHMDIELSCSGDLQVDEHHTAEDCAIAMGSIIDQLLEERRGIYRFGFAYAPLDEALARAVVDFSGRPFAAINLDLTRETIGEIHTENISHFLSSFALSARCCLHVDVLKGENNHHRAEAAYKALALACRRALAKDGTNQVPSTKGVL
jgi:imidazoleglycerol-phosphate dehydratase